MVHLLSFSGHCLSAIPGLQSQGSVLVVSHSSGVPRSARLQSELSGIRRSTWSRREVEARNLPARSRRVAEARWSSWSRREGEARPCQECCGQQRHRHFGSGLFADHMEDGFVLVKHRLFSLLCFSVLLVTLSGWFPNPCLCDACILVRSSRLVQVCSNLTAKTMRKGRKRVRIRVRNARLLQSCRRVDEML